MDTEDIKNKLRGLLSETRFKHSLNVAKTAVSLAKLHSANAGKAEIAGLLHDCAKHLKGHGPHGIASAYIAKKKFGIRDKDILNAIANHTCGRTKMSKLEKIIYISDHIEPGRKHKKVSAMRSAAKKDLNKAIALIASGMIRYLLEKDVPIFEQTLTTRNYYLNNG